MENTAKSSSCLVSVIVPIYNVEKYIEKCVDSLMKQSYQNIEIILVNDGSKDGSLAIIEKQKGRDNRIKVLTQENRGVSAARNLGMESAKGEYLLFVDGDDWVESDYVEHLLGIVEDTNCMLGYGKNYFGEGETKSTNEVYSIDALKAMEWIYSGQMGVAVWNKIYKVDFLKKNHLTFSESIWYGEGMLFNIECLQYTDQVVVTERAVYHQTFNPDSAVRNFKLESNYCGLASMWLQRARWKKESPEVLNEWKFHKYRYNRGIIEGLVRTGRVKSDRSEYRECVSALRKDISIAIKNCKTLKSKLAWIAYYAFPKVMAQRAARKINEQMFKIGGGTR